MPFIDMVLDEPAGNAVWSVLSIGKKNLSLRIPSTFLLVI
jgi:hypothetical protein